jgi:hypothetical protein
MNAGKAKISISPPKIAHLDTHHIIYRTWLSFLVYKRRFSSHSIRCLWIYYGVSGTRATPSTCNIATGY